MSSSQHGAGATSRHLSPGSAGIGGLLGVLLGLGISVGIAALMIGIFNWVS